MSRITYRRPLYLTTCLTTNMDPKLVAELQKDLEDTIKANDLILADFRNKHAEMVALAINLYGPHSKEVKYIKRCGIPYCPRYTVHDFTRKLEEMKRKEDERKAAEEKALRAQKDTQDAILWLQERGQVLGVDFILQNAVNVANHHAYQEEVRRQIETIDRTGILTDFGGQNCERPCNGWNGVDNRCECGNRRVFWEEGWDHSFRNPSIHAQAG